jgi:hypothetical protein
VGSHVLERMRGRARDVRTRRAIQRWQYRQRRLAAGVWYRLRRVLADAQAAYVIAEQDARQLVAEGYRPDPCGADIAPAKVLVFVDERRLAAVASRRPIPVALGADFLAAAAVALVPFEGIRVSLGGRGVEDPAARPG